MFVVPPEILDKAFDLNRLGIPELRNPDASRTMVARITDALPLPAAIEEGHTILFVCPVSGRPRPQISWLRDGIKIMNSTNHVIFDSGVLLIRRITIDESGQYRCVAENPAGTKQGGVNLYVRNRQTVIGECKAVQNQVISLLIVK